MCTLTKYSDVLGLKNFLQATTVLGFSYFETRILPQFSQTVISFQLKCLTLKKVQARTR